MNSFPRRPKRSRLRALMLLVSTGTLLLAVATSPPAVAEPSTVEDGYTFGWVPIGGGGRTPGVAIHPTSQDVIYARTDTSGPFRWDAANTRWTSLVDKINNAQGSDNRALTEARGITLDPNDADVVYVAINGNVDTAGVYKSLNRGDSFTRIATHHTSGGPLEGHRIAVDPLNSGIVFYGSANGGLRRSGNATAGTLTDVTFVQVGSGTVPNNVHDILFDPRVGNPSGASKRIYAAVYGDGIYATSDGSSWARMAGSPQYVEQMALTGTAGELVVTTNTPGDVTAAGVRRFDGSSWVTTSLTDARLIALASDPDNRDRMAAMTAGSPATLQLSIDGGKTWAGYASDQSSYLPWKGANGFFLSVPNSIEFDPTPGRSGHLWVTDVYGVWRTSELGSSTALPAASTVISWDDMDKGLENTIASVMVSPNQSAGYTPNVLLSGTHDVTGFRWTSLTGPAARLSDTTNDDFSDNAAHIPSLAAQWNDNRYMAWSKPALQWDYDGTGPAAYAKTYTAPNGVEADRSEDWWSYPRIAVSSDGGQTWAGKNTPLGEAWSNTVYPGAAKVAIARNDANKMVYLAWNQLPHYTSNALASTITWNASTGANANALWTSKMYDNEQTVLTADKHQDNTFYLYTKNALTPWANGNYGYVLKSTDGGQTWSQSHSGTLPVPGNKRLEDGSIGYGTLYPTKLLSLPDNSGELWLMVNRKLFQSADSGGSFAERSTVTEAYAFGAGKGNGNGNPALYVAGKLSDDRWGIFRSTDLGASWVTLRSGSQLQVQRITDIEGDNRTFGRFFYKSADGVQTGMPLHAASTPTNPQAGLDRKRYTGTWSALPDFGALTPANTDTTANFTIPTGDASNYGYAFSGYVDVPTDGIYTFYTTSDDGSKLSINGIEVVDNDGLHGSRERSGTIGLKAGKHPIKVTYFEATGGENLSVAWDGPNLPKAAIPNDRLLR